MEWVGKFVGLGQAVARIAREMFEAQRNAESNGPPPILLIQGELETGMFLLELSKRLAGTKFDQWVEWAPKPDPYSTVRPETEGNQLFLGALGWILRHELAHHVLGHHSKRSVVPDVNKAQELEADARATEWLKGEFRADSGRQFEERPSPEEMELERRALAIFVGLTWIAQFELGPHGNSATHPDAASRLVSIVELLGLSEYSFATEVLSYIVKVMIDPEGDWNEGATNVHSQEAATDAAIRLNRYISSKRQ